MGVEQPFLGVKLFAGFIYSDSRLYRDMVARLAGVFSPPDQESPEFNFDFTTYYNNEMGESLFKRFVSFQDLVDPVRLPEIKLITNRLEDELMEKGSRTINIDPGYLSHANVILATTKNHYHRIPLDKGIYAHMEYVIKKKNKVSTMEWTYPDFRTQPYMDFFNRLIPIYKENIKTWPHREQTE